MKRYDKKRKSPAEGFAYERSRCILLLIVLICCTCVSLAAVILAWRNVEWLLLFDGVLCRVILCVGTATALLAGAGIFLCVRMLCDQKRLEAFVSALKNARHICGSDEIDEAVRGDPVSGEVLSAFEHYNRVITKELYPMALEYDRQLISLTSQITPHFLYNTIDSIRGDALANGYTPIADVLEAFALMARDTFKTEDLLRSFAAEVAIVDNYMRIQRYRFGGKCKLRKEFDADDLDLMNYLLPTLSLQPLIENSMFHGVDTYASGGVITIRALRTAQHVIIKVEDNGVGMTIDELETVNKRLEERHAERGRQRKTGIALSNINARIKFFYGENYGISISSHRDFGTTVTMLLPSGGPHEK